MNENVIQACLELTLLVCILMTVANVLLSARSKHLRKKDSLLV